MTSGTSSTCGKPSIGDPGQRGIGPLAIAVALSLCGCRAGRVPRDELVVLIEQPAATLDPRAAVGAYDYKLSRLVYAPLVSADDPRLETRLELAESIERRSPTEYVVRLREARFSDGRAVTADDVVYTIESARATATNSLKRRFTDDGLVAVEPLDPRTVRFRLSHPHAPFVSDLDDVGILERPPPGRESEPPLGAGPFALVSIEGERWRFRANPYFYGGAPPMRSLLVKVIRDDNSRLLALVGGSGDLTQNTVSPLLLDAVAAQPRLQMMHARSAVYTYIGLNCDDPILRDPRVRRAIAYAIDRERIVRTKLGGRAVLSTGLLPPMHWAYAGPAEGVESYPFDPARARALLDEAGYPMRDGRRFTLVYKTSSNRFRVALAQVLAAQLGAVGIDVDVRPLEWATFFADVKAGNFQLFTMQIPDVAEPDGYVNLLHSSRVPTRERPDAGANRMRYRNPELDRWLERAERDLDRNARIADYREVQRIVARDAPVISLWHEDNVAVMGRDVRGFEILPTAQLTSLARTYKAAP